MTHGSLFSGIGGFDLAAEWMGWENVFHCEFNPFCQKILKHYWPDAKSYGDITKTDFTEWEGKVDIISGGFPCQPFSQAGKRKGKDDDRHLWPEMLRAIREIQPGWIVGENVPGLLNWKRGMVLAEIKADLESAGFEVFPPCILPACGKNAPHRRDRLWVVAYSKSNLSRHGFRNERSETQSFSQKRFESIITPNTNGKSIEQKAQRGQSLGSIQRAEMGQIVTAIDEGGTVTNTNTNSDQRCKGGLYQAGQQTAERYISPCNTRNNERTDWKDFPTQSPVCGGNDGIPNRVDRIKALGNAIVPQVAYEIFKTIEQLSIVVLKN